MWVFALCGSSLLSRPAPVQGFVILRQTFVAAGLRNSGKFGSRDARRRHAPRDRCNVYFYAGRLRLRAALVKWIGPGSRGARTLSEAGQFDCGSRKSWKTASGKKSLQLFGPADPLDMQAVHRRGPGRKPPRQGHRPTVSREPRHLHGTRDNPAPSMDRRRRSTPRPYAEVARPCTRKFAAVIAAC